MDMPEMLVWSCHFCGLETPEPTRHLAAAHGTSIEDVMRLKDELEARRRNLERLLMLGQELAGAGDRCYACGQSL